MKPSNQLFDLIKSLTPDEEFHFNNSSSIQQGEKNYIKLYNFLKNQDEYDEDAVKQHFKNEVFIQHLASEKNQLLHHILKSLRNHRQETSASAKIDEEIKNIHEKYENEEDYEDYEDFEHYLNESFSQMNGQKLIVHDIFITQPSRYDY